MPRLINQGPRRPLLRYHGGKWRLAPWIIAHFPPHRIYVEAFGGAASVLLRKPRSYAEIYNELDGEICNLFRMVRDRGPELQETLKLTPFAREEFLLSYKSSDDPLEQARRTIVRSLMGIGSNSVTKKSGFRSDSRRVHTIPAHDFGNYPACLAATIGRLSGVIIENRDALTVIRQHDTKETLHYLDPPYVRATRNRGRDYRHEMCTEDYRKLADLLHGCAGMIVLSGYASDLFDRELFTDWRTVERKSHAFLAKKRVEKLYLNEAAWKGLNSLLREAV